ncbi:MAG: hypothetical protein DMD96_33415 [Candidatus Rokuibacteriota bacterium]|nr:MAG: hypothetical protein DMD96_33415 [Candidatus Rokubacteria bacterium]
MAIVAGRITPGMLGDDRPDQLEIGAEDLVDGQVHRGVPTVGREYCHRERRVDGGRDASGRPDMEGIDPVRERGAERADRGVERPALPRVGRPLPQRHQPVVRHLQERLGPELGDDERAQARHAREDRQDRIGQHDRRRVRQGPVDENAALAVQDAERHEERRRGGVLGRDRRRRDRAVQPFTCRSAGSSSSLMSLMLASA